MGLTVHNLDTSQGERIVWLCEELGLRYNLVNHKRAPLTIVPLPELLAIHPTGSVPLIEDDTLDSPLAESGAVMLYISNKHANGKLTLPPSHPAYADYLYWFHWTNSSLQPVLSIMTAISLTGLPDSHRMLRAFRDRHHRALSMMDARVKGSTWLAGEEFTLADIMVVYSITTFRVMSRMSLVDFPHIVEYLKRVGRREGYRRAMKLCNQEVGYAAGPELPPAFAW